MTVRQLVSTLGLAAAAAIAAPACVVSGQGSMGVEATTPGIVYTAPPQAQIEVEAQQTRPGFLWIGGHYQWQNGQYVWLGGHWERERAGYAWTNGHWDQRGNGWIWVDGTWNAGASGGVTVTPVTTTTTVVTTGTTGTASGGVVVSGGMYPTSAPPALQVESYGQPPQAGFVWIAGRWNWTNGNWAWVGGHWERGRANMTWNPGRWQMQGDHYVWIEGQWGAAATVQPVGPVVRDHRH